MTIIGFTFFYFVFLKVFTSIAFYHSMSIIACLICAIIFSFIEIFVAIAFRRALNEQILNAELKTKNSAEIARMWFFYIASIPIMIGVSILISVGFSPRFFETELQGGYREFMGLDWENILLLGFGIALMTVPHMIMTHLGLKAVSRGEF